MQFKKQKLLTLNKPTASGIIFPVDEIKRALDNASFGGSQGVLPVMEEPESIHPGADFATVQLSEIVGYASNFSFEDSMLYGDITIIDTPKGQNVKYIAENYNIPYNFYMPLIGIVSESTAKRCRAIKVIITTKSNEP